MKTCARCGEKKDESGFHKKKAATDGLSSWCRQCKSTSDVERQRKKLAGMTGEELALRGKQKAAHRAVARAVKNGSLLKPDSCSLCGVVKPFKEIHGHHEDYDKPLCVVWICRTCHLEDHGEAVPVACMMCGNEFKRERGKLNKFCQPGCWYDFIREKNAAGEQYIPKDQPDVHP